MTRFLSLPQDPFFREQFGLFQHRSVTCLLQ